MEGERFEKQEIKTADGVNFCFYIDCMCILLLYQMQELQMIHSVKRGSGNIMEATSGKILYSKNTDQVLTCCQHGKGDD